ncbi:DUF4406 domain-containing protein [Hoeflea sp. G2-23]|uniref:DUF4406 domain-containing protein n=1 Tax=Hoeflea algicola TaxID=2983763 RepID=A0ABT3Z9A7_9HYPH|nr:DUF4406 domain-containing protein [Hoeflea algicola]MCY0148348.1 DUF4406 domain-containing protein [Hoeflea algicola]
MIPSQVERAKMRHAEALARIVAGAERVTGETDAEFKARLSEMRKGAHPETTKEPVKRKIYLSGPMKGYPGSNYDLFTRVAGELRAAGHEVHNPAEFPHDGPHGTFPLRQAFAAYCAYICNEADTIVLLPGWQVSLGVSAELALAKNCGLEVAEYADASVAEEFRLTFL